MFLSLILRAFSAFAGRRHSVRETGEPVPCVSHVQSSLDGLQSLRLPFCSVPCVLCARDTDGTAAQTGAQTGGGGFWSFLPWNRGTQRGGVGEEPRGLGRPAMPAGDGRPAGAELAESVERMPEGAPAVRPALRPLHLFQIALVILLMPSASTAGPHTGPLQ